MGCRASRGGAVLFRVFPRTLLPFSACAAMGDADSGVHLLADDQCEYQRDRAQFYSQPVLPFEGSESSLWNHAIDRVLFFADDVRCGAHAAPQRELGPQG